MRKILTGDIEDLEPHIIHWERNAHHHMPTTEGKRYKKMQMGKERQLITRYERNSIRKAKDGKLPYEVEEEKLVSPNEMRGVETFEFEKPGGKKTIVRTIKFPVGTFKFDGQRPHSLPLKQSLETSLFIQ